MLATTSLPRIAAGALCIPRGAVGAVTIRRQQVADLDADLESKDDEQIDWLWLPGQRESWEAMTPGEQRAHALSGLQANHEAFGTGPKWTFAVDASDADCVAYVDCDLANGHVPSGEANISYTSHPSHQGKGHVSRAVRVTDHGHTLVRHMLSLDTVSTAARSAESPDPT